MKYETSKQRAVQALTYAILLMGFAVLTTLAWAQGGQRFTGHVLDSTGAVIPEAQVTILNQATNAEVKTLTTSAGDYSVPFVVPGTYTISVEKSGFQVEKRIDILLNVDQTSTINFQLQPGRVTQTITVSGSAAQIELSKADRGEVIDSERISETSLDSRNPFGLFELSPGAHNFSQTQFPRPFDQVTHNLYASGSPQVAEENIDGVTNEAGGTSGAVGLVPSVDVLAEYKVNLNPYDSSFSHGGGNSVDLQLKSGANKFHGVVDYFMRRPWLDAYPWQTDYNHAVSGTPLIKPPHKRDQYSFEADGPVFIPFLFNGKDKLFFTISYEYMHDVQPFSSYTVYSIPSPAMIGGDFSQAQFEYTYTSADKFNPCGNGIPSCLQPLTIYDPLTPLKSVTDPLDGRTKSSRSPFPGNRIPTNRIDPVGAAILGTYSYLTPNINPGVGFAPYTNNYQILGGENDIWRNGLIKIDYHVGPKDSLTFRWGGQGRWNAPGGAVQAIPANDPANQINVQTQPHTQTGSVQWTHTFSPTLLLNFGSTLISETEGKNTYGATFAGNELQTLGFNAGYYNQTTNNHHFPFITASALPNGAAGYAPFSNNQMGGDAIYHSVQFLPVVTKIRAAHAIRAGIDLRIQQNGNPIGGLNDTFAFTNNFTNQFWSGGPFNGADAPNYTSGSSIASLLLGYPNTGAANTNLHPFFSQHYFAPWVQDDWKITKRLTLNLGLRWDFNTPPVERHNKMLGIFNQSVVNPVSGNIASGSAVLGANTQLQGGLEFAGVNGQPRAAYALNKLQVQPRIGFAYAIGDRMSLRGGVGTNFLTDQSENGSDGFSNSTSYTASNDNNLTPYTATTGLGFAAPLSAVNQITGSSLGYFQDLGRSVSFQNPHLHIPQVWNYSLEYQAQVTKRDVISVAYVGNRVPNLTVNNNLNQVTPEYNAQCDLERGGNHNYCDSGAIGQGQVVNPFLGVAAFKGTSYYTSATIGRFLFTEPYPEFSGVTENGATNNGRSWYNSLQASASHQASRSLSLHVAYTHAKDETAGGWVDQLNNVTARNVSTTNDMKHQVAISGVAYLPFGRGRWLLSNVNRWIDEAVNGWEVSPIYTWYSGFPWRPGGNWEMAATGSSINKSLGVAHTTLAPDGSHPNSRIRGATPCVGSRNINTGLIDVSASQTSEATCSGTPFITAANYAVGRNTIDFGVRQPGAFHLDLAASKNFAIPDVQKIFRSDVTNLRITVDFLNAFNHPTWDRGYNGIGLDFGTINKGPTAPTDVPRYLQLSAKLNW